MFKKCLIVMAALVVLAGCGTSGPQRSSAPMPSAPKGLASFYAQRVHWYTCGALVCGRVTVPLDYAHPDGKKIQIALLKIAAIDQAHKVGDLLVNPGGPGASGIEFAAGGAGSFFRPELVKYYDLIGFDPRGVGRSAPINCGDTQQTDAIVAADPDPSSKAEWATANATAKAYLTRCQTLSGALAGHVSTVEAARDLDIIRAALNQPRLDYYGASYGTFLGATYAGLFPHNVGRLVLDGAMDPTLSTEQTALQQAHSFEAGLRSYVTDCVKQGHCILGRTVNASLATVRSFLDGLDAHPLRTGTSRLLTSGLAVYGVWAPLYVRGNWPELTAAFTEALTTRSGAKFLELSDGYVGRGPQGYLNNSIAAQSAVNCLDRDDPVAWQKVDALVPQFEKASPTFGRIFAALTTTCAFYPVQTHQKPRAITAAGAAPILVLGTTRDPVTPLAWAKALASQLASGVLVTRNGDGHTAYSEGNDCINKAVENYLVKGTVPRNGLAC